MSNISTFSSRLKHIRLENHVLQKNLAEKLGLAQTTIANYEQGKRFPDEETLLKIADFFNVSLDYLLGRTDVYNSNEDFLLRDSIQLSKGLIEPSIMTLKNAYMNALISGKLQIASQLILNAVSNNTISIKQLYIEVLERSLVEIGQLWDMNIIDIYQEHYFTYSTELIMSQLYSHIQTTKKNGYTVISLSSSGNSHNIGIRMVTDFLEIDGWNTYYLGSDVPTQSVIKAIKDHKADIVAISCTMPQYLDSLKHLITAIRNVKELSSIKIILGGRLFNYNQNLWESVLADGYSSNASDAVNLANQLMKKQSTSELY